MRRLAALAVLVLLAAQATLSAQGGVPLGPEFRVNTFTTGFQFVSSVASDSAGKFVVVWDSISQDGDARGIFGQRYSLIVPVELLGFTVE